MSVEMLSPERQFNLTDTDEALGPPQYLLDTQEQGTSDAPEAYLSEQRQLEIDQAQARAMQAAEASVVTGAEDYLRRSPEAAAIAAEVAPQHPEFTNSNEINVRNITAYGVYLSSLRAF